VFSAIVVYNSGGIKRFNNVKGLEKLILEEILTFNSRGSPGSKASN